jgi:uncharacterized protein YjiS (DUF1127 family)
MMTCTTTDLRSTRSSPRRPTLLERWLRLQHYRERALAEHRLRQLDDRLLRDIGIERADIPGAVRGR